MTKGEQVAQHALSFAGHVAESPRGSNTGNPEPNGWERRIYGGIGVPWCACAVCSWWEDILGRDNLDGLRSASTQALYDIAVAKGLVLQKPVPGCAFVYPGVHTGIVTAVFNGTVATCEGNHGDRVATDVRAYGPGTGLYFIAPKVIKDEGWSPAQPERLYYIENLSADPILFGPWRTKKGRDAKLAKLPLARRKNARPVQVSPGKFGWLEGPRRLLGPWTSRDARDNALKRLQAAHPKTPYRTLSKVRNGANSAAASPLGKTT
jgi:hypothetical protein